MNYSTNFQTSCRSVPAVFPAACLQVSCIGQLICAVVADTKAHGKRGAAAVKISYEDLPDPIFTIEVCPLIMFSHDSVEKHVNKCILGKLSRVKPYCIIVSYSTSKTSFFPTFSYNIVLHLLYVLYDRKPSRSRLSSSPSECLREEM